MTRVAVFDLDRTIIAGSSAEVFAEMLRAVGVDVPAPPGRSAYFDLYERFGEDPITMQMARYAARLFAGHAVTKVEAAGRLAADVLVSDVLPQARAEFERHRSRQTTLLLATTVPRELAQPLADNLGFDDVLCTCYRSSAGVFDGANDGEYLWGHAKARRVGEWAAERNIDLAQSWAYSDSWSDVPLLERVGHAVAVNPDLRLNVLARVRGWPRLRWTHPD